MCVIYFENTQCSLINVYHHLLLGRRNETKQSTEAKENLFFQFAYLSWESLLKKPVANQPKLFNCDEQRDVV